MLIAGENNSKELEFSLVTAIPSGIGGRLNRQRVSFVSGVCGHPVILYIPTLSVRWAVASSPKGPYHLLCINTMQVSGDQIAQWRFFVLITALSMLRCNKCIGLHRFSSGRRLCDWLMRSPT